MENSQHQKAGGTTPARNSAPAPAVQSKALPLEWLLDPEKSSSLTDRVLARLIQLEAHEPDVWLRDDYRQAFIAASFAAKGIPNPFVEASYVMYGLHPEKLYPAILVRRSALLGSSGEAAPHSQNTSLSGSPLLPLCRVNPRQEELSTHGYPESSPLSSGDVATQGTGPLTPDGDARWSAGRNRTTQPTQAADVAARGLIPEGAPTPRPPKKPSASIRRQRKEDTA